MVTVSKEQIQQKIPDWRCEENIINKKFQFSDFKESIRFVDKVAEVSEAANHHPDIQISYNVVKIILTTHSENGVTQKDIDLAVEIERIK